MDEEELERFRNEWRQELNARPTVVASPKASVAPLPSASSGTSNKSAPHAQKSTASVRSHESARPTPVTALECYEAAVTAETEG
jgi:hypothetical protein